LPTASEPVLRISGLNTPTSVASYTRRCAIDMNREPARSTPSTTRTYATTPR
jgi:hypothetical protein